MVGEHRKRNWCCVDWACKRHSCAVVSEESAGEVKHDAHRVSFPCHETPDYDCWDACNTSEIRVRVVGNTEAEIALAFRDGSRKKTVAMAGNLQRDLLPSRLRRGDKLEPKVAPSKVVVFWRAAVERIAKGKHPLFDNALDNTPNRGRPTQVPPWCPNGILDGVVIKLCCVSVCGKNLVRHQLSFSTFRGCDPR